MKKRFIYLILGVYLLFIVSIPLFYFFFYGPTQNYRCSVAVDTKNHYFFLIGDEFALDQVVVNDKDVAWQKQDDVFRSVNIDYKKNKLYRLFIRDKQDNFIDLNLRFPQAALLDKQLVDLSCETSVVNPTMTVNKNKLSFFENKIDTEYVFSSKKGDMISVENLVIDMNYETESAKLSYGKFFSGLFGGTVRYSKVSWNFFMELNKYVFNVTKAFLRVSWSGLNVAGKFFGRGWDVVSNSLYKGDKSALQATKFVGSVMVNRSENVINHAFSIFKNNYVFVFFRDISGNTNSLVGGFHSGIADVFRGAKQSAYNLVVAGRLEEKKRDEVVVKNNLASKIYTVGVELGDVEFSFFNGLGEVLAKERVKVYFSSKAKNNSLLLSPMTVFTNNSGNIKVKLRFGHKVSDHELKFKIKGKEFIYDFMTEAAEPSIIEDFTNRPMLFAEAGKLVRKAFKVRVYDSYKNAVPGAIVDLMEQDIDAKEEPFKFAEVESDEKGRANFDYRMSDSSGRALIIAKNQKGKGRFVYTVQSESTEPYELLAESEEEIEAIVGIPLKKPFRVRVIDDKGNPCPHVPIEYSFQTGDFEELQFKSARTDKSGRAEVEFRTPEIVGDFQIIASSPKLPDYEVAFVVLVMPGNAAKMSIESGDKQTVEWGKNSNPLRIKVKDDRGNPIPDVRVKWRKSKSLSFGDYDDVTDYDGFATMVVKAGETKSKENYVIAEVGKVQQAFKLYPKQPSYYKLYLKTNPIVNVFTSQMLADPIEFNLKDQYGDVKAGEKVSIEYIVYKRGVQYLQNYNLITNEEGIVTFNFLASDQNDVINLKGKYYVEGKPRITWVKINVIPEEISNIVIPDYIEGIVGNKLSKAIQVFVADNNASPVTDIFLSIRLKKAPLGANADNKLEQIYQLKTNKQGMAEFNPTLGKLKGNYVYTAKINTLEKDIVINAAPDVPSRIRLVSNVKARFPVFREISNLGAQMYDKHDNLITKGKFVYNVNSSKKVLRHDFNKIIEINETGLTKLPFETPERKGSYYVYVSDKDYSVKEFYKFEAYESGINGLILLSSSDTDKDYVAGRMYKGIFRTKVLDRFGNFVEKAKLSVDLYKEGSVSSSVGSDAFTLEDGVAAFDIHMPEQSGVYSLGIYSEEDPTVRKDLVVTVLPEEVYKSVVVSGNNQKVEPNSYFKDDFTLKLIDRYDNPVSDEQVRWSYFVMVRGERRQYTRTLNTNKYGVSTFNFQIDENPGVREIMAYYKQEGKWVHASFYIKVIGLSVEDIKKIAGDNQQTVIGDDISDFYVVKALDMNGNALQDIPIVFRMFSIDGDVDSLVIEYISNCDENGIAKQKFRAPIKVGKYQIVVYPQFQEKQRVVFDLQVDSEEIRTKSDASKEKEDNLLKFESAQAEKQTILIGDNSLLCEVTLIDRYNVPVVGKKVEWEIYDVIKDVTYQRATKTDEEGKTYLPEVNRGYARRFVVKVIEPSSRSSLLFNVDIVKELNKDVSLNFLGMPMIKDKADYIELLEDETSLESYEIVLMDGSMQLNISKDLKLFVGQKPQKIKVFNNKDSVVLVKYKFGKRDVVEYAIPSKKFIEVMLTPNDVELQEKIVFSSPRNRMVPWIKDSVTLMLVTDKAETYSISHKDSTRRAFSKNGIGFFSFIIKPVAEMEEGVNEIDVQFSIYNDKGLVDSQNSPVAIGEPVILDYLFQDPGEYRVVVESYLLDSTLSYSIRVFDGDYILRPISEYSEYVLGEKAISVPISFEVVNNKLPKKIVGDYVLWEVTEKPLGAVLDFFRRTATNRQGIASIVISGDLVRGSYAVRARRLFAPDQYIDFEFKIK